MNGPVPVGLVVGEETRRGCPAFTGKLAGSNPAREVGPFFSHANLAAGRRPNRKWAWAGCHICIVDGVLELVGVDRARSSTAGLSVAQLAEHSTVVRPCGN